MGTAVANRNTSGKTILEHLKSVKEQLRTVPQRGLGYGLLRWIGQGGLEPAPSDPISFNYLGQFDGLLPADSDWQLANEPIGSAHDPQRQRSHLLDVNALVVQE